MKFQIKRRPPGQINARRVKLTGMLLRRTRLSEGPRLADPERPVVPQRTAAPATGVIIFKSELDYLSRCILDRPDIETGGQLFGYFTREGVPVVMYAIGPGPDANHEPAFFNQDKQYLVEVGKALKKRYGLVHIGEWHSHHRIAPARPSRHDVDTMLSSVRECGLGVMLLCIGNISDSGTGLNAFLCDENACRSGEWDIIYSCSPVRSLADRSLANLLIHPRAAEARHTDARMVSLDTVPDYASGYWLNKKGSGTVLNRIMEYLKRRNPGAAIRAGLNDRGEVVLSVESGRHTETILLPSGFPMSAPRICRYSSGRMRRTVSGEVWDGGRKDIYTAFIRYYETI